MLAAATLALVTALWVLNRPFYTGSTLGPTLSWRLEHGRLNITRRPSQNPQGLYIAVNAGPPRWNWDAHVYAADDWFVRIPLWTPWLLSLGWAVWAWRPRRFGPGRCRRCGYSIAELPPDLPCPECGTRRPTR